MTALRIAVATLLVSTTLTSGAFAQTGQAPVIRENQVEQVVRPQRTRPLREGVTGLGQTQDVIREPRFIVEAVNFKAVDESGPNNPWSDEVMAIFRSGAHAVVGEEIEDVDTGNVIAFEADQSCIWPLADDDGVYNNAWHCEAAGARGPIAFSIELYELDGRPWRDLFPWTAFCVRENYDDDVYENQAEFDCMVRDNADTLFTHEFSYSVPEILARLDPSCRCFTETARYTEEDWRGDLVYEVTFRITRVDDGRDPPALDRDPGGITRPVHRSGVLEADLNQHFEFDAGSIVAGGGDFAFTRSNNQFFLTPNAGGRIWLGNATARGYAACAAGAASHVTTAVQVPAAGTHACYVTSDGRVGELRIIVLSGGLVGGAPSLELSYTTWQ